MGKKKNNDIEHLLSQARWEAENDSEERYNGFNMVNPHVFYINV